jgi:hypothetical protein
MHMVRNFESLAHFFDQWAVRVILTRLKVLIQIVAVLSDLIGIVKRGILPPTVSAVVTKFD